MPASSSPSPAPAPAAPAPAFPAPASCPLCHANRVSTQFQGEDYVTKEIFSIVQCESCRVAFTWPRPDNLDKYYPRDYRKFAPFTRWLMQVLYRQAVRSWVKELGFTGRAFDIGCGNGWMMQALHDGGWDVMGFERTPSQAQTVEQATGFKVFSGSIDQIEGEKFDLILLFNVVEHLTDPVSVVRQCSTLLTERGVLILNAPNFASWQATFARGDWAHLEVPRHLFHFSRPSFEYLLAQTGLRSDRYRYNSWVHDPYGWDASLVNKLGFERNRITRELTSDNFRGFFNPSGFALGFVAALLVIPSILLAVASWACQAGALIEVWAKKDLSRK